MQNAAPCCAITFLISTSTTFRRDLATTRKLPKPPEEIENLMIEGSRGVKKTYMDLFSKVLNSAPVLTSSSMNSSGSSVTSTNLTNSGFQQQAQQMVNAQRVSLPRPIPPSSIQPHTQIMQVLPPQSGVSLNNAQVLSRPRYHAVVTHPNNVQLQSFQQKNMPQTENISLHTIPISTSNRIVLPPGVSISQTNQISLPVSTQQQPVVLYQQQQQPQNIVHVTPVSSDPTRQSIIGSRSVVVSGSTKPQPGCPSNNAYVTTSSPNTVLIRTTSAGCVQLINPSGTDSESLNLASAVNSTTSDNAISTLSGNIINKPVLTVVHGATTSPMNQSKLLLPANSSTQRFSHIVPNTTATAVNNISNSNAAAVAAGTTNIQHQSRLTTHQQQQSRQTGPPNTAIGTSSGSTFSQSHSTDSDNRSTSQSKRIPGVKTPEVQAQIVKGLTTMANRYLSAVKHAIQLVSKRQEAANFVRKYVKLKDILENPEANLHVISFMQLPLIEQLLQEIERNPMHLVEQRQRQIKSNAAAAAAAAAATAAASASNTVSTTANNQQRHESHLQSGVPSNHSLNQSQQQQQSISGVSSNSARRVVATNSQANCSPSQNKLQGPVTNLNTLLSQPFGAQSPTSGAMECQSQYFHTKSHGQYSVISGNQNMLGMATRDGISIPTHLHSQIAAGVMSIVGSGDEHARPMHSQRLITHASFLNMSATSANASSSSGFYATLHMLAAEFEELCTRMLQDENYSRRVTSALHEVYCETKGFLESLGVLLPQDVFFSRMHKVHPITPSSATLSTNVPASPRQTLIKCDDVVPGQQRKQSTDHASGKRPHVDGGPESNQAGNYVADNYRDGDDDEQDEVKPKPKKLCIRNSISSHDTLLAYKNNLLGCAGSDITREFSKENDAKVTQDDKTCIGDKTDKNTGQLIRKNQCDFPKQLFCQTNIIYDPESDPLIDFPPNQLEKLNPKILHEIAQLKLLHIHSESNSTPPLLDEMETYATCLDAGEWNTSCHLKLTYINQESNLIYQIPHLFVRLSPDYLKTFQLNWYYLPKNEFLQTISHLNPPMEQEKFLTILYEELDKQFHQLRKLSNHCVNLNTVGKTWVDIICSAMARFVRFDYNMILHSYPSYQTFVC